MNTLNLTTFLLLLSYIICSTVTPTFNSSVINHKYKNPADNLLSGNKKRKRIPCEKHKEFTHVKKTPYSDNDNKNRIACAKQHLNNCSLVELLQMSDTESVKNIEAAFNDVIPQIKKDYGTDEGCKKRKNTDSFVQTTSHNDPLVSETKMGNICTLAPNEKYKKGGCSEFNSSTNMRTCCDDKVLFDAITSVLKNIIFYKQNIATFFSYFHYQVNKINNEKLSSRDNNTLIEELLRLCVQFSETNKNKKHPELSFIDPKEIEEVKKHENTLINKSKHPELLSILKDSTEYKKVRTYNLNYTKKMNAALLNTEFRFLLNFLKPILSVKMTSSKYYNMIADVLGSLYDISLIIHKNLKHVLNKQIIDKSDFEVLDCCCSKKTKENFVFHWAFCWIMYFSRRCFLTGNTDKSNALRIIEHYPQEFFVQFLVLVHYNINYKNNTTEDKYIDKNAIIIFKTIITKILFEKQKNNEANLLQLILYNLLVKVEHIKCPDIHPGNAKLCYNMKHPYENYIQESGKLVLVLQDFIKFIFELTKESFKLTKMKIN